MKFNFLSPLISKFTADERDGDAHVYATSDGRLLAVLRCPHDDTLYTYECVSVEQAERIVDIHFRTVLKGR